MYTPKDTQLTKITTQYQQKCEAQNVLLSMKERYIQYTVVHQWLILSTSLAVSLYFQMNKAEANVVDEGIITGTGSLVLTKLLFSSN